MGESSLDILEPLLFELLKKIDMLTEERVPLGVRTRPDSSTPSQEHVRRRLDALADMVSSLEARTVEIREKIENHEKTVEVLVHMIHDITAAVERIYNRLDALRWMIEKVNATCEQHNISVDQSSHRQAIHG